MACRYYDDIVVEKLQRWLPEATNLRILKPDETKRLFELTAVDTADAPLQLPLLAIARDPNIELISTVKSPKSYDGIRILTKGTHSGISKPSSTNAENIVPAYTALFNVLPIRLNYQIDIYTKTTEEGDEYVRNFLFKLINNPVLKVTIPYNDFNIEHIANIRVNNQVSDTSSINERLFSGQFTRWTIQLEIQDAFLFSIPYKKNWVLTADSDAIREEVELKSSLELLEDDYIQKEIEDLDITIIKEEKN